MKIFIGFLLLIISIGCKSQSICVSVNCKDTVNYPIDSVVLNGQVTSPDGIASTTWQVAVGSAKIDNPKSQVTVARGLSKGGNIFVFILTGISVKGAVGSAFDTVIYIPNQPPIASCGPSYTDTTTTGVLTGSGTDPEGGPITFLWTQINGPNQAVINSPTFQNPLITGLITGTYIFQLTVTDNGGLTGTATQTVYVTLPVTQLKTVTVTTVTKTKYFSNNTTTTTTTTNTVTTVP
jgi:hypothetical protein